MYQHQEIIDKELLLQQVKLFVKDTNFTISVLANITALLQQYFPQANWLGFYLIHNGILQLGPFQGQSACMQIPLNKGVCGKAALTKTIQNVADVRNIENHISCDIKSISELVIPIIVNDDIVGVLDIDAPIIGYFTKEDEVTMSELVKILVSTLNF